MKPIFSHSTESTSKPKSVGAPRYKGGDVVSPSDWECIAVAFGFSSAVEMFRIFRTSDDRRKEWMNWNADKAIANHERSR